ncbi:twin-arginine translocation signal domain-containing protein [Oryzobacter telluris]|uniref:twin-arginine translocation signal domain-containing protein n=1 Tax=Oryzobacter telluris TaxID=3149179 RepID=UPI00370D3DC0
MAGTTRRGFLAAAGSGTAVAVVATAGGASASPRSSEEALEALDGAVLVAYIDDPRSGVLSLMVGEDEVEIHDPALVRRLVKASGGRA